MNTSNTRPSDTIQSSSFDGNIRDFMPRTHQLEANAKEVIRRLPTIFTEQQIKRLKEHKYASEGTTLVDPYMQHFWNWLVQYCPLWVAPNLLTIIGLAINIGASILLMILTDGAKEQCTGWMYFLTALGLFIYQSLDAIDGKQARRTNSSSPLGELFDHGCDSVSTVFITVAFCCAIQLGAYPWLMFCSCVFSCTTFYCAHWQTYVSGKLRFGKFDCTEAELTFIVVHLISAIAPGFWTHTIPMVNVEYRVLAGLVVVGSTLWSMANNIYTTISCGTCENNVPLRTRIICPAWPVGFFMILALTAAICSQAHILQLHTTLFLVCYGIVFSKITNRLIVAHMSESSFNAWDSIFIGPIAVCINQFFNCWIDEHILLWFCLIYNLYDLLRYNIKVCQELCDAFDIYCFRIKQSITTTK